ncbi:hypothetical protein CAOG_03690 [Capsaspora owczarzaki ATCC 30864]|uniref:SAM domain-containing protein n=1 Tax=Capsaspora owczarzaki (strain ATCC 30864) TaxID=595528 RepID=A0A0D2UCM1_CAPO3|nr:hypothetical protein CAOG_03690 [Capsaspora owczarzaki ATCC 30864]KJE92791.1 hypothetical protein CAOG_003690 [Capsaspora owczarzaki ATCC 30864]|eukprot:XP_004363418.1 hypothetical protein CAOG_03690 [Capsaspora owczarzaki ATCC 30864]
MAASVADWLEANGLGHHLDRFAAQGIVDVQLCADIEPSDLDSMGLADSSPDYAKVLAAVAQLKASGASGSPQQQTAAVPLPAALLRSQTTKRRVWTKQASVPTPPPVAAAPAPTLFAVEPPVDNASRSESFSSHSSASRSSSVSSNRTSSVSSTGRTSSTSSMPDNSAAAMERSTRSPSFNVFGARSPSHSLENVAEESQSASEPAPAIPIPVKTKSGSFNASLPDRTGTSPSDREPFRLPPRPAAEAVTEAEPLYQAPPDNPEPLYKAVPAAALPPKADTSEPLYKAVPAAAPPAKANRPLPPAASTIADEPVYKVVPSASGGAAKPATEYDDVDPLAPTFVPAKAAPGKLSFQSLPMPPPGSSSGSAMAARLGLKATPFANPNPHSSISFSESATTGAPEPSYELIPTKPAGANTSQPPTPGLDDTYETISDIKAAAAVAPPPPAPIGSSGSLASLPPLDAFGVPQTQRDVRATRPQPTPDTSSGSSSSILRKFADKVEKVVEKTKALKKDSDEPQFSRSVNGTLRATRHDGGSSAPVVGANALHSTSEPIFIGSAVTHPINPPMNDPSFVPALPPQTTKPVSMFGAPAGAPSFHSAPAPINSGPPPPLPPSTTKPSISPAMRKASFADPPRSPFASSDFSPRLPGRTSSISGGDSTPPPLPGRNIHQDRVVPPLPSDDGPPPPIPARPTAPKPGQAVSPAVQASNRRSVVFPPSQPTPPPPAPSSHGTFGNPASTPPPLARPPPPTIPSQVAVASPVATTLPPKRNPVPEPVKDEYFELDPEAEAANLLDFTSLNQKPAVRDEYFELEPDDGANSAVSAWLTGLGLQKHLKSMIQNGYDDMAVVREMTDSDFEEIGITNPRERATMMDSLR